ncbi:Coenzyme F420 hydrogenase/dehydrogenase, beta subunit C-terminal domain [Agrococcus sp. ProA11]|uniref:Coenzyme F420 hydrogenase/dehydrogenase, beta subunit C-terminal domain n=1 Tax=Agrococcus chionoecetis TaxID=3153752 RepID=UPI00326139FB
MTDGFQRAVGDVVARQACSGCGLCTRLDASLRMALDADGYLRPRFDGASRAIPNATAIFRRGCPGVLVRAPSPPEDATIHPLLGAHVGIWNAWAADPELRHAGSSGGALSAIHTWLVDSGRAARVTGAAADPATPRRSVPVTITSREHALRAAGSRYAPVASLDSPDVLRPDSAVCGKPCEISAIRQTASDLIDGEAPLLLSFFCAGTPSQSGTDALLADLGIGASDAVDELRYRGNGWPGRFTARSEQRVVTADYDESWGRRLGPTTQWRCKVCVDGVGESADIVSADSWVSDDRGYPVFTEGEGRSALLARTPRGRQTILDAQAAGVIVLEPLEIAQLARAQPLQTGRRRFLSARLLGSRFAGRRPPAYRGYRLLRLSLGAPRTALRALRGTFARVRREQGARR